MLLADMGATVIKVESPAGDETRTWTPPEHDGVSTYYLSINRNKRSIVLDFNDPDDVELTRELLRRADVAVENFKPGGLRKFGLDYESARGAQPAASCTCRSAGSAPPKGAWLPGLRPRRAGGVGPDEPHRRTRRPRLPRRRRRCST